MLSMQGKVVEAKPQALHKRKEARFAAALDSEHNPIHRKDIVKVIDGPHSVSLITSIFPLSSSAASENKKLNLILLITGT